VAARWGRPISTGSNVKENGVRGSGVQAWRSGSISDMGCHCVKSPLFMYWNTKCA